MKCEYRTRITRSSADVLNRNSNSFAHCGRFVNRFRRSFPLIERIRGGQGYLSGLLLNSWRQS